MYFYIKTNSAPRLVPGVEAHLKLHSSAKGDWTTLGGFLTSGGTWFLPIQTSDATSACSWVCPHSKLGLTHALCSVRSPPASLALPRGLRTLKGEGLHPGPRDCSATRTPEQLRRPCSAQALTECMCTWGVRTSVISTSV